MNVKKVIGILLIIGGVGMIGMGSYIKSQVEEGKQKISSAQEKVDTGNSLFSMSPATKELGQGITGGAQKKIDAGKRDVKVYEAMSEKFKWGGIASILIGIICLALSGKKSRRS